MRRKAKVIENIEHFSVLRALMAVDRADVCVIVIDATVGFTEQDSKVAGYAHDKGKACVIAVNKWDAVEDKTDRTMDDFRKKLEIDFSFMSYAPFVFISAKTGQRIDKLFELIKFVHEQHCMRISTGVRNSRELFHYSYQRYIENQLRETFGLTATPIKLTIRERGE